MHRWPARPKADPLIQQVADVIRQRISAQIFHLTGSWTDVARDLDDRGLLYRADSDGYARVRREARAQAFRDLADEFGPLGPRGTARGGRTMYTTVELRRWLTKLANNETWENE